jgi:hypothetical protein
MFFNIPQHFLISKPTKCQCLELQLCLVAICALNWNLNMLIMVFWVMMPCSLHVVTSVSEEHTISIFSVKVQLYLGYTFLWMIGNHLYITVVSKVGFAHPLGFTWCFMGVQKENKPCRPSANIMHMCWYVFLCMYIHLHIIYKCINNTYQEIYSLILGVRDNYLYWYRGAWSKKFGDHCCLQIMSHLKL